VNLYRRLFRLAAPHWREIVALFAVSLLATPLALLAPLPLKIAVDSVLGTHPLPGFLERALPEFATDDKESVLLLAAGLYVLVALLNQLQDLANLLITTSAGEKLVLRLRAALFRHAQRLSLALHDARGTADSIYRIQYDASSVQFMAIHGIVPLITSAIMFLAMVYVTRLSGLRCCLLQRLSRVGEFSW
jgi:ATP-binding cassette subfamily B protein